MFVSKGAKREKKQCAFCKEETKNIDYKNIRLMRRYLSQYGKIQARYYTGVCLNHQKKISRSIKLARIMALIPYIRK